MTFNEFVAIYKSNKELIPLNKIQSQRRAYAYWRLMGEPESLTVPVQWLKPAEVNK